MKNIIRISYPRTEYPVLNQTLIEKINIIIQEFVKYEQTVIKQDLTYTLDIVDESYDYNDYISYVLYTSIYTGGAHPNNIIITINYDRRNNKIITINDLIRNQQILENISIESRKQLKQNEDIGKDKYSQEMLLAGTTPNIDNFKNFIFVKEGIKIYFEQYQVAPYSSGVLNVIIPYHFLKD